MLLSLLLFACNFSLVETGDTQGNTSLLFSPALSIPVMTYGPVVNASSSTTATIMTRVVESSRVFSRGSLI